MFFASDNWAGAHPRISDVLRDHSSGFVPSYGSSDLDHVAEKRFAEIFEHEVAVFFLPTGTAANSLALAAVHRAGGIAFAHPDAHIREDEGGAPEFLTGGVRVRPVAGSNGRIDPDALRASIAPFSPGSVNMGRATAVSLTQATEIGTVYAPDRIGEIAGVCREHNLPLHMDGARFANALASLGCSAADMTWRAGVDMVSFGGTKNGCWCAEALVFFDPAKALDMPYLRKRSGQLFSKSRFVAAQFLAYFEDNLWLDLAAHANGMARELAGAISRSASSRLAWSPEANEVFSVMPKTEFHRLQKEGVRLHEWLAPVGTPTEMSNDEVLVRLVTSYATEQEDVSRFAEILA